MNPKIKRELLKALTKLWWIEKWIDVKYGILTWVLLKTAKFRVKHSKKIIVRDEAYFDGRPLTACDVEVQDSRGWWLPYGFMIMSRAAFDDENLFNVDNGFDVIPWEDYKEGGFPVYMVPGKELGHAEFVKCAKDQMKRRLGNMCYDKDFEFRVSVIPDKWADEEAQRIAEWEAAGKPPYKIAFTDHAKEDFKEILGETEGQEFIDDIERRNKENGETL